jgi:hypothetical protein
MKKLTKVSKISTAPPGSIVWEYAVNWRGEFAPPEETSFTLQTPLGLRRVDTDKLAEAKMWGLFLDQTGVGDIRRYLEDIRSCIVARDFDRAHKLSDDALGHFEDIYDPETD